MTWNTPFQPLAHKVCFEKSADSVVGTPLWVTVSFSLAAFKVLFLSLTFSILITMCLGVVLLGSAGVGWRDGEKRHRTVIE